MREDEQMELTEFLLARIAEDEKRAEGTGLLGWATFRDVNGHPWTKPVATTTEAPDAWFDDDDPEDVGATVQAVYDERRVLAECEAKRRIVEHFTARKGWEEFWGAIAMVPLKALAAVYADHPDYREEWRP